MDVTERREALALVPGAGEGFELFELLCGGVGVGIAIDSTGVDMEAEVDEKAEAEATEVERRGDGGGRGMDATRGVDGEDIGFGSPVRVLCELCRDGRVRTGRCKMGICICGVLVTLSSVLQ